MDGCVTIRVFFLDGGIQEFPVHQGGSWAYREGPHRVVVRPYKSGHTRHEVPLMNVKSIQVVRAAVRSETEGGSDG